jgi:3-oxoacyl-[acyl-carrier protein] reductase
MDLGIAGRKAIVCGGSKGLGKGCAMALAREGVQVTLNSRSAERLTSTADEIRRATGAAVTAVAADVTAEAGRTALLAACPDPDILVTNSAGPPAGDVRSWSGEDWMKALNGNMVAHILLIKAVIDGMIGRRFGRIVNITSGAVKSPYPSLGLSNGARAGLTGFVAGLARQVAQHNVTINNLLPGSHETDRLRSLIAADAKSRGIPAEQALAEAKAAETAKRFGTIEEFGAACAFLCSAHAGYIAGQNLLLDGGSYNGTL